MFGIGRVMFDSRGIGRVTLRMGKVMFGGVMFGIGRVTFVRVMFGSRGIGRVMFGRNGNSCKDDLVVCWRWRAANVMSMLEKEIEMKRAKMMKL